MSPAPARVHTSASQPDHRDRSRLPHEPLPVLECTKDRIVHLHVDRNACIRYLNGRAPGIRDRLRRHRPEQVVMCSVVKAELFAGALRSTHPERTLARQQAFLSRFVSLPFDDRAAEECGLIRARLEAAGIPIGPYDLQIAAIAVSNNLILVTHNTREFGRIERLEIEDWEL